MKPLSKETIRRGALRAFSAFCWGAISAFAVIPINLDEPEKYLIAVTVGMVAGGLMGLQKLITGWAKYDR